MYSYKIKDSISEFKQKALQYASDNFDEVCYLEGNNQQYLHSSFPSILAFGNTKCLKVNLAERAFDQLEEFLKRSSKAVYGFLSYDLKNGIEELKSENIDGLNFPILFFFEPLYELKFVEDRVEIQGPSIDNLLEEIMNTQVFNSIHEISFQSRISKQDYVNSIELIKNHILKGDVYELNFCQEYFSEGVEIEPVALFMRLFNISPMPFSTFFKAKDKYLLCASPERFLKKEGNQIISQPIKGTVKRGDTPDEDHLLKLGLSISEKELAENIMIVDLVRNDLSKTANDGSVKVEELCGIYSFSNVHQMISTVVSELDETFGIIDVIKHTYPMGSMTGAPKIRAMQLIEQLECTKRGLFSGSVGYISPNGDFDFNVVIRSLLYNGENKYLSFHVGSAITIDADPNKEWDECQTKISAIKKALGVSEF